ncbi:MAG: hypothetical protein ACREID_01585, partial [Planctomycetota bacterium]
RRRVNAAIDRGAAALLRGQERDGMWRSGAAHYADGVTALCLLALLKAGVKPEQEGVRKAFASLRRRPFAQTYSVACLLMALEAKYFPGGADEKSAYRDRPRLAQRLVSEEDREWIREAAAWLVAQQGAGFPAPARPLHPVWRYPYGGYDLSNTQYALFGLSSANRCGVPTSKAWLPALRYLIGAQEKDGPIVEVTRYARRGEQLERRYEQAKARGFGYVLDDQPYGSMTSAGLCSLVLCQQALDRNSVFNQSYRDKTRSAIRDALAWLQEYYDLEENVFRGDSWWLYYLFNVERSGALLDMRYLGSHDWYLEGAELLLAAQSADGAFGTSVDTSFAILFLKRATVPALTNPLR